LQPVTINVATKKINANFLNILSSPFRVTSHD
jgi:hypothetical protein